VDVQTHTVQLPLDFALEKENEIEVVVRIELQKDHDS
jgi:hypothetical protein